MTSKITEYPYVFVLVFFTRKTGGKSFNVSKVLQAKQQWRTIAKDVPKFLT